MKDPSTKTGLRRMLHQRNTTGRAGGSRRVLLSLLASAMPLLAALMLGPGVTTAQAGNDPANPDRENNPENPAAPELAWADGEAAFAWVQQWVRSEQGVPDNQTLPDRSATGLFGVCVTLRDQGRVLGRGEAYRTDAAKTIDTPGPPTRIAPLLADATRQALDDLRDTLMNKAVDLRISDPKLFDRALLDTRQRVQIDVQLGYDLTSIVLPLDAPDDAVFTQYAPGFHGLRLAGPIAAEPSVAWPVTELTRNTSPPRTVFKLLQDQGYDAKDLPLIARGDGPSLQRFNVLHVVQTAPGQPVHSLTRGNLIFNRQAIDARTIAGLAENTAQYLDSLIINSPQNARLTVRGTYQPSADRYSPAQADPREAALLAYALTRHAQVAIQADLAPKTMRERADRALRLALQLAPAAIPDDAPPRHLTAAFILLTLCETPAKLLPDRLVLRDRLGQTLMALRHPDGGGYRIEPGSDTRLSRSSAAVVTAALAAWHNATRSNTIAQPAWDVLQQLMQANENDPRHNDLFWVAHALDQSGQNLANAQPKPDTAKQQLNHWHKTLADFLATLSDRQVRTRPALGPEDVLGGFVFQDTNPGTPPNPTWQSAIPLATFALALRNPDIVPADQNFGPLLTADLGARFLGQLMVTKTSAFYMRQPQRALGGVRNTLWDNTLTPDASAMTLLALAELQHTLRQLEP